MHHVIAQLSFEVMANFFIDQWSHAVNRLWMWQYSRNVEYAMLNLSSKACRGLPLLPSFPNLQSQTTKLAAMSTPKPMWKVWTTSGRIRFGESPPGTMANGFPSGLKGLSPGRFSANFQGASESCLHQSCGERQIYRYSNFAIEQT